MVTNAGQLPPDELGQDEEDNDENKAEDPLHEDDVEYKPDEPPPKKMKIVYTKEEREKVLKFFSQMVSAVKKPKDSDCKGNHFNSYRSLPEKS